MFFDKNKSIYISTSIIIILAVISCAIYKNFYIYPKPPYLKKAYLVAHALGGLNGKTYTNSKEAFLKNYQLGHRLFEFDLAFTDDGNLATIHERGNDKLKSFAEESRRTPYTLLSFKELCQLIQQHKGTYVITDTKSFGASSQQKELKRTFDYMNKVINEIDPKLANRFIIQVYNQPMYYYLSKNYTFKNYIYTLYASPDSNKQVVDFVKKTHIPVVTMWGKRATPDFVNSLNKVGAVTFAHTINEPDEINRLFKIGVFGIYTDFVTYNSMQLDPTKHYGSFLNQG